MNPWLIALLFICVTLIFLVLIAFIDNRLQERHQREIADDHDAFGFDFERFIRQNSEE